MGLDPKTLPERILNKLAPKERKALGVQSAAEARTKSMRASEKAEQGFFASELNYQRSLRRLEYDWNRTDRPVTGLVGRADFVVWLSGGQTVFFEFKAQGGRLSEDQVRFKELIEFLGYRFYLVYSAAQAIGILGGLLMPEILKNAP